MPDEMWAVGFLLDGVTRYLLVRDGSGDSVISPVQTADGRIVVADFKARLAGWVQANAPGSPIDLDDQVAVHELDAVRRALDRRSPRIDPEPVLEVWNLLDDVLPATHAPFGFHGSVADRAYDKLFWSLNLESVTPPGEHYVPVWSRDERRKIRTVLLKGIERFGRLVDDAHRA